MANQRRTPQQTLNEIVSQIKQGLNSPASGDGAILTGPLKNHIARTMGSVLQKTFTLVHQSPTINPGAKSEQRDVEWDLMPQSSAGETAPRGFRSGYNPDTDPKLNPYAGQKIAPDMYSEVERVDRDYPGLVEWDPGQFVSIVVERLSAIDPKFGYKSRRGGPVSDDTLGYDVGIEGYVEAIDIILDAGGDNPRIGWSSYGIVPGEWWRA